MFKVGDVVRGKDVYRFQGRTWFYLYEILDLEVRPRFGKDDVLYTVKKSTSDGCITDPKTLLWSGQLF